MSTADTTTGDANQAAAAPEKAVSDRYEYDDLFAESGPLAKRILMVTGIVLLVGGLVAVLASTAQYL